MSDDAPVLLPPARVDELPAPPSPIADPIFDRYARIVREAVGVPVALVSVVEPERQILPGAVGLPEPWQSARQTPLSHSFCQYVVADDAPLVIADARVDDRLRDNRAVPDLGVIAYAGYPLRAPGGRAIGSVCAIDGEPRSWTAHELTLLADIADVCSTELALRQARQELTGAVDRATRHSARTSLLLALSEELAETITLSDVAQALQAVATRHLGCEHAGIWIDDGTRTLRHVPHPSEDWGHARRNSAFPVDGSNPLGAPLVAGRPLYFADRSAQDAEFPGLDDRRADGRSRGRMFSPLMVANRALGTLVLTWDGARLFTDEDRSTIAALTSYTAQAVQRATLLAERSTVAHKLQAAMLGPVPERAGRLQMAARYVTASVNDEVGGDWYDAVVGRDGYLQLAIGDVAGHDVDAAAVMGAMRNMLRALAWAGQGQPARIVADLDQACQDLGVGRHATLVFGRVEETEDGIVFRYTNAAHVPPVVLRPGAEPEVVQGEERDVMIGIVPGWQRREHLLHLPSGSTLVLYTDGLVERRADSLDDGIDVLRAALGRYRHLELDAMLDATLADVLGDRRDDDVAVVAVRVHAPAGSVGAPIAHGAA